MLLPTPETQSSYRNGNRATDMCVLGTITLKGSRQQRLKQERRKHEFRSLQVILKVKRQHKQHFYGVYDSVC